MSQTIKDKVKNQIQIHQQLVNYYDSDSDSFEENQVKLSDLPRPTLGNHVQSDDSDTDQHEKMNLRRKKILQNLQYSSKENISPQTNKQERPLKPLKTQALSQEQNKQLVQLKAKIAQLLKQSQQKSSKITELQTQLTLMTLKVENLKQKIQLKQANLKSKQEKITSLTLENKNISQNYQNSLKEYEKEYKRRTDSLHNEVTQINQSTLEKDKKIDILTSLVKLKDQELQQLKKNDQKAQKCIAQNSKLKADLNQLITLLQTSVKGENLSKSLKNIFEENLISLKPKKQRSKSFAFDNIFLQSKKIKTPKHLSSCFDAHYASLPSKGYKNKRSLSDWVPTDLINQVESFLKKWRMAQNNKKFVNSLVSFIHAYIEKCVNQTKSRMENQYKSLKKEIQRKANQSLVLGEIMKQRQLKIKFSKSQNKEIIAKSPMKGKETKIQNLNLNSQDVSILLPASNKKFKESRKNNFLCGIILEKTQKDDIGYTNLEKSMKIHRENSAQAFDPHLQMPDKFIDSFILQKRSCFKDKSKHYRTQSSVKSSKKQSINSSSKKRSVKSVSQKKSFDFPLRKFKII